MLFARLKNVFSALFSLAELLQSDKKRHKNGNPDGDKNWVGKTATTTRMKQANVKRRGAE